jgi:hypothetical protein
MNTERSSKSHATAWTVMVVLVPMFYLLTVGPLEVFVARVADDPQPRWLSYYARPYRVLYFNTPLGGVMNRYELWWARRVGLIP